LTEKEREKLTVFLHKGAAGEWDFDVLANEFDVDDLLDWGFEEQDLDLDLWGVPEPEPDPGAQIDRAEELREQWGVESGQLWRLGEHRLICGDCTDAEVVARVMDGEKAQSCFTSPPYNVDKKYDEHDDDLTDGEYWDLISGSLNTIINNLVEGGVVMWNVGVSPKSKPHHHAIAIERAGFIWLRQIIWEKVGAAIPIWQNTKKQNKARYYTPNYKHEVIYLVSKGDLTYGGSITPDDEYQHDIWNVGQFEAGSETHPAAFPIKLVDGALRHISSKDETVFDPFLGSGTTLIACERLGRRCRAVEISPAYCAVAIQRWVDMTGQEPELVE
jgi:DNA modification methylase